MKRSWLAWLGLLAGLVVIALTLRWFLRSDAQRLSDAVGDARDALVEQDDPAFLAFFTPDVTYLGNADLARIEKDLRRWHELGIQQVHILDERIEVDRAAGTADVGLTVVVGTGLLRMDPVEVEIDAVKDAEGDWRVRAFSWKRP